MRIKLNWGFGIAVAYILFAGSMVVFAVKASQQHYDLVTPDYYNDAVKYQQKIDAEKNALSSSSKLNIEFLPDIREVVLSSAAKNKRIKGTLLFYKPDKAGFDFEIKFLLNADGSQHLPVHAIASGYWKIKASYTLDGDDCYTEKKIVIK
jgi:nitrogen fixation protein FixH